MAASLNDPRVTTGTVPVTADEAASIRRTIAFHLETVPVDHPDTQTAPSPYAIPVASRAVRSGTRSTTAPVVGLTRTTVGPLRSRASSQTAPPPTATAVGATRTRYSRLPPPERILVRATRLRSKSTPGIQAPPASAASSGPVQAAYGARGSTGGAASRTVRRTLFVGASISETVSSSAL
jgi:hypothetical protein